MCMIEYFPNYLLSIVESCYQGSDRLKMFIMPVDSQGKTHVFHTPVTFQSRCVIPIEKQMEFVDAFHCSFVVPLPVRK